MRRSLLLRLLGLSLAVAVFAVAATAWLTMRDTSERFRGEFERTLEADTFIYKELTAYAVDHESWDGVHAVVDNIAEIVGRRVVVTTLDGDVLADSASSSGQAASLPSNPTAEIDARTSPVWSMDTTYVGYQGDSFVAEQGSRTSIATDAFSVPGDLVYSSVAAAGVPSTWRMSEEEHDRRRTLVREAQSCLRDVLDTDEAVVVTITGEVLLVGGTYVDQFTELQLTEEDVSAFEELSFSTANALPHPCVPEDLYLPTDAALEFNARETALKQECLDEGGASYNLIGAEGRLFHVVPGPFPPSDAEAPRSIEHELWSECEASARAEALSDFVAEPALLYTGSAARFDPFFGDGWRRTALAGAAVLVVATGVTVLAGRRLARPIRALTGAARRMGDGDHTTRVAISGHDEVAQLAGAFNSMAESIEANDAQRRAMISDIAHELRTPLSNVRGYLEAAEDGVVPLDPALVESLLEESVLLQRLIDDLQDLALADAGMLRVHAEPRDIVELSRQVVSAHRASADDAGVRLVADVDPGPTMVDVDPERIRQALGNLVSNAVRFTPEGGTVTVSVRSDDSSVALTVGDTGSGIPSEHLPRLFDRFYRVEGSRSRRTGGSGLGLAITKHLVEAHDGTVDVHSVEGEGSVFTIRLPAHRRATVA